jgi:hypothetical protein
MYHNGYVSGDGLLVANDGKIAISNLTSNGNKGDGANLDNFTNRWTGKFLGVTLTGFNTFENNLGPDGGLFIDTDGSAILSHLNADNNTNTGIDVIATKNITVMCASSFHNTTGFILSSGATITLVGVHSYYNLGSDVFIDTTIHTISACP